MDLNSILILDCLDVYLGVENLYIMKWRNSITYIDNIVIE